MKSNQWITDRLPMAADLDEFGHILKPDNTANKGWCLGYAKEIKLGDPWFPVQTMPTYISPDDVFWDKPSDFPPFCWLMTKEDTGCYLVTNPSTFIKYRPMSAYRWAPQPFDSFAEGSLYTNTIAGTPISVNTVSDNFAHGDLICRVVDSVTGAITSFTVPAADSITVTNKATTEITYLGASASSGTIIQQSVPFFPEQTRSIVPIGKLLHHDNTNITEAQFRPAVLRANSSNFNDFLEMTGPVTSGFQIGVNTIAKALTIGPGRIMLPGACMNTSGSIAPNTIEFPERVNHQAFKHVTQDGSVGAEVTELDTTNYNATGNTIALYSGGSWCATRSIWQGFDGTVYVLYPKLIDSNGETCKNQNLWYHQPVPHWLWEVAVPIALLTAEYNTEIFDNTTVDVDTPIIDQLQPMPKNWPHRTVQATVFPS